MIVINVPRVKDRNAKKLLPHVGVRSIVANCKPGLGKKDMEKARSLTPDLNKRILKATYHCLGCLQKALSEVTIEYDFIMSYEMEIFVGGHAAEVRNCQYRP